MFQGIKNFQNNDGPVTFFHPLVLKVENPETETFG